LTAPAPEGYGPIMRRLPGLVALIVLVSAPAARSAVTPANVADLALKWEADSGGTTGGPSVRDGRVYYASWNSAVRALDALTGEVLWSTPVAGAVPGRVLLLDDGGVCYGTLLAEVGCLNGADGSVRWKKLLDDPQPAAVWSAPVAANGRLFVGIASINDDPACSRGRLVALDLATGDEQWRFYTVPEKVCDTDTAVACTLDAECPNGGACVTGRGGGVTSTPAVDPTGAWVYMNTVGCYTFPSIGESDSMFKIDATNGDVVWRKRVDPPEQFGACSDDSAIGCGVDGDCSLGATCEDAFPYNDFGFLNGPILVDVPDGPGTKTLVVSGSKNGTLYAFEETDGEIAWTNVVRAKPINPGFAGFGLFNGAITSAGDRIFAALNALIPPRVCANDARVQCNDDGDCPGSTCPPERKHLMAFDASTGTTVWEEEIGRSWSATAVVDGVVYAGTNDEEPSGASWVYAHDVATGARLATLDVPFSSTARVAVEGDTVYVGYGTGQGGVRAYSLCANTTVDPGEECDAGPGGPCCSPSCTFLVGTPCDDGDACSATDQCNAGACAGSVTTVDQVDCKLQQVDDAPCGDAALPTGLSKAVGRALTRTSKLLAKAAATDKPAKVEKLRRRMIKAIDGLAKKVEKAAEARKEAKRISPECRDAIQALLLERRTLVEGFAF
jgi:outer membrane protein assembly factor BamB